ncbi:helix-turn-helix domain-containing protein [Kitasatospora sp. NPDC096147]|uniref:helix-turn-helix domain-containing protein n=1 Tax=Kitasatospora sp. NPDC096147 TaxID=3364093 RepID=UPI0037F2F5A1
MSVEEAEARRYGAAGAAEGHGLAAALEGYRRAHPGEWSAALVAALAQGHREVLAARERWVRLAAGDGPEGELRAAAERAGFDPLADCRAWLAGRAGAAPGEAGTERLRERLGRAVVGRFAVDELTDRLLVLGQGADEEAVTELLGPGCVAVGLERIGPDAARRSVRDARAADRLAAGRPGVWRYAELWPLAVTAAAVDRLDPLLAPAVAAARTYPHLAEAVRAFADHGFDPSAAARALLLPPEVLERHLRRWRRLTGADVRTLPGLTASRAAVELAAADPAPWPPEG